MTNASPIEMEIDSEIGRRYRYARFDFILNHLLVFVAVIASAFPAFSQLVESYDEATVAMVAAVPAFVLLLQKTFKWEQRGEWHWEYRRRIIAIKRQIRDQGLSSKDASVKLNNLERDLAGTFPGVSHPTHAAD